jgi:predicted ATPase/class 3 adenylate cyclase
MTALPSGEVTLLFTDVEGSTRLWELHGTRMLALLAEHDRIVAEAVADAGGVLQLSRAEGDSSFAVFSDPASAISAAVALQRSMSAYPWPDDLLIRTRAALHTGTVELRGDTYYGPVVNRCVRLRSLAHGGQTILSKATRDAALASTTALGDVLFADLGTHRLKDIAVPERVFELRHPDLEADFPPLRSPDVERHNLPELQGRFVGRQDDQRAVEKALTVDRLVTIVGTGGVGKTRLALEVAWRRVAETDANEGTWFVNLTPARTNDDAEAVLAAGIGAREQPGRPLVETIVDQLADKAALVVLDNCEHVMSAARHLTQALLRGCPNVRVLATSREALGLDGERRRVMSGLAQRDAVELFVDRARFPRDGLDDETRGAVERLAARLDGIPLAIEIAAARAAELGVDRVERGLARTQLEDAGRTVLEATLQWSHDLLEPDERVLFRRLGVFVGQFTLNGAEAVVAFGAEGGESLDVFDVLDLLASLVERSLVVRTDQGAYRQLFVVRECAIRLATDAGEYDALAERHLSYFVELAESLRRPDLDERGRFDPLRQVNDDLIAALDRTFGDDVAGLQVRLAAALDEFWYLRGAFAEGRARLEAVLDGGAGFRSHRAEVHRSVAYLARWQGDLDAATDHLEQARALFAEILGELSGTDSPHLPHFQHQMAHTLLVLSEVAVVRGDASTAAELAREAIALSDAAAPVAMLQLGTAEHAAGLDAAADRHIADALRAAETRGDDSLAAQCICTLGVIARASGDLATAESHYSHAAAVQRQGSSEQLLARTLLSLAELLTVAGRPAADVLDEGLTLARAVGDREAEAHALSTLADIAARDDPSAGAALHNEALALRVSVGAPTEVALSEIRVAAFAEFTGDLTRAAEVSAHAASVFRGLYDHRGATEALAQLARVHARRGDVAAAVGALTNALDHAAKAKTAVEHADILDSAAWLSAARDRRADARRLLECAAEHRANIGVRPSEPTARLRTLLEAELATTVPSPLAPDELVLAAIEPCDQ